MDFEHAYLTHDWLLEMMMSFSVGGGICLDCVVGIRCWKGGFAVDLCERGMPVWEIHCGI